MKMKEIEESVGLVERHLPLAFKKFATMGLVKDGIYKRMEFAIQNVFDICAIINADLNLGIPADDKEILDNLVENKVLSSEMKEKLKLMKGFRNILVHRYGKIDDKLAFKILKDNIKDFYEFIKILKDLLK
ncbi:MAG: DUF86 domain-containing protein [Methanobacteriaceae archaeon]